MKLDILHTIASIDEHYGGPSRSVPALCKTLNDLGLETQILTQQMGCTIGGIDFPVSVSPYTWQIGNNLKLGGYFRRDLQRLVKQYPHLILHDHGLWLPINHHVARIANIFQIPRIVSLRGMLTDWTFQYGSFKKKIIWELFQKQDLKDANFIHVTSVQEAEDIRKLGMQNDLVLIPNGVSIPKKMPNKKRNNQQFTALFLSRIHPKKGVLSLIEAWSKVKPPNWELLIVGIDEDGYEKKLKEEVARLGLIEVIKFLGPVKDSEKWNIYRSANLFVLPSKSENFGIVIAEALAAELPVITTKATPWHELLSVGCGWWIDTSTEALVTTLKIATEMPSEQLEAMGKKGKQLVTNKYSWKKAGYDMLEFYDWIQGRGGRPNTVLT